MKRALVLMTIFVTPVLLFASSSAGEVHHPSIKDLVWPAFNFVVLFGFLGWKLKKPITENFTRYATDIATIYERAAGKHHEAIVKKETYQKKLSQVEKEKEKILADAHADAEIYRKKMSEETQAHFSKMQIDMQRKLESEYDSMVRVINEELVNAIVASVKKDVRDHKDHQKSATGNLLAQVK